MEVRIAVGVGGGGALKRENSEGRGGEVERRRKWRGGGGTGRVGHQSTAGRHVTNEKFKGCLATPVLPLTVKPSREGSQTCVRSILGVRV